MITIIPCGVYVISNINLFIIDSNGLSLFSTYAISTDGIFYSSQSSKLLFSMFFGSLSFTFPSIFYLTSFKMGHHLIVLVVKVVIMEVGLIMKGNMVGCSLLFTTYPCL